MIFQIKRSGALSIIIFLNGIALSVTEENIGKSILPCVRCTFKQSQEYFEKRCIFFMVNSVFTFSPSAVASSNNDAVLIHKKV